MPILLFLAFIAVPLVELFVIGQVSDLIGLWPTIALLVVDSLVGAWLVKREGRRAWDSLRTAFTSGQWPADQVTQGGLIIFGGALLLTPGFVTDALGLLSVLPPTRAAMSRLLRRWTTTWASRRMASGSIFTVRTGPSDGQPRGRSSVGSSGTRRRRPANDPGAPPPAGAARDRRRDRDEDAPDVEVISVERDAPDA